MMGTHRKNPDRPAPTYSKGYCKPPAEHQFRPGRSGNPKGRPKRKKTVSEEIDDILMETVAVSVNGRSRKMTRQSVILKSIGNNAMKGDQRAAGFLFNLRETHRDSSATSIDVEKLTAADRELLEDYLRRSSEQDTSPDERLTTSDGADNA